MKTNLSKPSLFWLRLILALLFVGIPALVVSVAKNILKHYIDFDLIWVRIIHVSLLIGAIYLGYAFYVKWTEKRTVTEYDLSFGKRELLNGMMLGAGLITIQVVVLWLLGVYSVQQVAFSKSILHFMLLNMIVGFLEELVSKGIIFRLLEEGLGSWIALIITILEAGLTHLTNDGATLTSTLAVGLEFGAMQALIFLVTRRLWVVTGLHFAWNFTMGGIFGLNVSGMELQGLLHADLQGPLLLTGGQWGIEAALPAIILCTGVCIYCLIRIVRGGNIIKPLWAK